MMPIAFTSQQTKQGKGFTFYNLRIQALVLLNRVQERVMHCPQKCPGWG